MEKLTVYAPGDRLATMTAAGVARVWQVTPAGLLAPADPRSPAEAAADPDSWDAVTDDDPMPELIETAAEHGHDDPVGQQWPGPVGRGN